MTDPAAAATALAFALDAVPLVAILRGVRPDEAADVAEAVVDAGFRVVEVPLNSPAPLESIAAIVDRVGDRALVGAGTVLEAYQVPAIAEVGGQLIVAPNLDPAVGAAAAEEGAAWVPGVLTPTEMFAAADAGAAALKLFPASASSPAALAAVRKLLPASLPVLPVGGIGADDFAAWREAGADGFGVGGTLYRPGRSVGSVAAAARALVAAVAPGAAA